VKTFMVGLLMAIAGGSLISPQEIARRMPGEGFRSFSDDGAWCWFADPRAVYRNGKIYGGWVDSQGSIWVASMDPVTGSAQTHNLHPQFDKDDHANPALLFLADGRLMVFYSAHGGTALTTMRYRVSQKPEDMSAWSEEKEIATNTGGPRGFCYANPVQLSKENGRIYLFWRGGNFKPTFSYTDDGKAWAEAKTLIQTHPSDQVRPYMKVAGSGGDRIHFAFTDGHPRNEPANGIYYACYRNGCLYKADGTLIKVIDALPLAHAEADRVYNGKAARAWIWDIAADPRGRPVIAYTRLPQENDHRYHYACWDGSQWQDHEICAAGKWFPETPAGKTEPEPHYSGGIVLDPVDATTVYLSRQVNGIFEIERWTTPDAGKTWRSRPMTSGSSRNNVRPFVVRDHPAGQPFVLWMSAIRYIHYTDFRTAIKMSGWGRTTKNPIPARGSLLSDPVKRILGPVFGLKNCV
jgi:hypothetical protein